MAKGDDIESRLIDFAVAIIGVCDAMPPTRAGNHIAGQLLRSGTSPAPNYGEARSAESRKDFIHKLKISLKELNESRIWLEITRRAQLLPAHEIRPIARECVELSRILNASITTARSRMNQR